jgi:hypothetical protein
VEAEDISFRVEVCIPARERGPRERHVHEVYVHEMHAFERCTLMIAREMRTSVRYTRL